MLDYRTEGLGPDEEFAALQVPDQVSPRLKALAERWRDASGDAAQIVARGRALFRDVPPIAHDARIRYGWVRDALHKVQKSAPAYASWRTRMTDFLNRPVPGTIGLFLVMAVVFQAVFAWATPLMDAIDERIPGWPIA